MLTFRKIELKDLNEHSIGMYIKDSNKDVLYKVINWVDGYMEHEAILEDKSENGGSVDESTLLRDYDLLIEIGGSNGNK